MSSECFKEYFINLAAKSSGTANVSLVVSHGIVAMHKKRTESRMLHLSGNEETQRGIVAGSLRNTAQLLTISYADTAGHWQWTLIEALFNR